MAQKVAVKGNYRSAVRKLRSALKSLKMWHDRAVYYNSLGSARQTFEFLESNANEQAHNRLLRRCDEALAARLG